MFSRAAAAGYLGVSAFWVLFSSVSAYEVYALV